MSDLSRRDFVTRLAVGGFALAVQPVTAATLVQTPSDGLVTGMFSVPASDGMALPLYRAMPQGDGTFPVVLVVQEIFGVHEHIKDVCRRLARAGYCAVAPELYFRQGDVSQMSDIAQIIETVVARVPDAQVLADLDTSLQWAVQHSRADAGRAAITGFCWGGRITWLYAAHNPALKAGAAWYGKLVGSATANTPQQPVDIASSLTVPVLGLYGGADTSIPLDTVEAMRQKVGASGSEFIIYKDAPHAFNADYRPSYREVAAKDAWAQMLAWFRKHGV